MASYSSRNSVRRNVHSKHGDRFLYELSPGQIGTYNPGSSSQRNYLQPPSVNVLKVTTPSPSVSQRQGSTRRTSTSEPQLYNQYGINGFTQNTMNQTQPSFIPPYGYTAPYVGLSGPMGFVGQNPPPLVLQGPLSQQNAAVIPVEFTPNFGFGYGGWHSRYPYQFSKHHPQQSVIVLHDSQSASSKKEKSSSKHHYYGPSGEPLPGPPKEFTFGNHGNMAYNAQSWIEKDVAPFNEQKRQSLHLPPIHQNFTFKGTLDFGQLAQVEFGDASKLPDFVISELQQKYGHARKAEVTVTAANGQYNISGRVLDEPKDENTDNNFILEKYLNDLYKKQRKKKKRRKRHVDTEEETDTEDDED
ncbi:uncharacterized protein LOC106163233 [Lingula anatina]|uniref:Uncharacterized protein LOC106163233 n=1 Tax=Lingula anatina TaxID=7574 RepID=A0A1S3IFG8_LINAN|nr:uncharacterized protein LOC106163233 [Lingula anatina]|eukprot:XP_013396209.1 uncharacterized protein LOC106163233 [Lingula anatina]